MMIAPEHIAAFAALVVFATVLHLLHKAHARREREGARRQWQAELRSMGA